MSTAPERVPRWAPPAIVAAGALIALFIAGRSGVHHVGARGLVDTSVAALRTFAAATILFGLCGLPLTRLLLPQGLRGQEALWVLPVGACVAALALTLVGFAAVPLPVSLVLVLVAGLVATVLALRRRPLGRVRVTSSLALPAAIAVLLTAVALIPYFLAGFPTATGVGSDSHMAAGTAEFLRHHHPLAKAPEGPVDQVPLLWRSKQPIYYALAAVSELSGLDTWEVLSPLAVLMLSLTAVGWFVMAQRLLAATLPAALAAMAVVGLDRMVLHTGTHVYFNQTWGYFTLPFSLVLAWWVATRPSRAAIVLLALFLAVGAFAYPLALPIPLLALAVFVGFESRDRLPDPRRLWRGPRSLLWMVPLAVLLAVPVLGVVEKSWSAAGVVLDPGRSLQPWAGDLLGFVPAYQFFALPSATLWWLFAAVMLGFAVWLLRGLPRGLGVGLGAVLAAFLGAAVLFRHRDFGQYFEFKALAFTAPLLLVIACSAAGRLRRVGPILLVALVVSAQFAARPEVATAGKSLSRSQVELRDWVSQLPPGASVRLDIRPGTQLWSAYMMSARPLCSIRPITGTQYPHVPFSRKADFVVVERSALPIFGGRALNSVGAPLRVNHDYALYRLRPGLRGPDRCSRRMIQTVTSAS